MASPRSRPMAHRNTSVPTPPQNHVPNAATFVLLLGAGDHIGGQQANQDDSDPDAADPDRGPQHPGAVRRCGAAFHRVASGTIWPRRSWCVGWA